MLSGRSGQVPGSREAHSARFPSNGLLTTFLLPTTEKSGKRAAPDSSHYSKIFSRVRHAKHMLQTPAIAILAYSFVHVHRS